MDNWSFGLTVTIVGMGGTLFTLWILSLVTTLLKKAFPPEKDTHSKKRA